MSTYLSHSHGVFGDLVPEDDLMHPVSEASSHNESMFFNFFDTPKRTGGFVRIGNRPNEGHAEMTFCLFLPDGSMLFQWGRPAIEANDRFEAAGLCFEVVEPGEHLRIRFVGEAVHLADPLQMVDPGAAMRRNPRLLTDLSLDCRATSPLVGSASGDSSAAIFLQGVGHYQQACTYRGRLSYADQRIEIDALGVRDHSWGKRVWHDIHRDRSFWACADERLGFIACKTWSGEDPEPDIVGCVIEDGAVRRLKSVVLTSRYADSSARHQAFDLELTEASGRCWALNGQALSYIPLRHRRPDRPVLHLGQAMSLFSLNGGPAFLGLSEYFDAQSAVDAICGSAEALIGIRE
ncbi:DUF7064 domain-containing protein [Phenylobacterium sp.]|jgi:hypothetical protein|uniref:DUF7064 domain-containing protein n=1 Tax=Phenylobacterium sp. TaxID=1871053 RepID=UPI002F40E8CD